MKLIATVSICLLLGINIFGQSDAVYFTRINEPNEKALSLLVPKGWIIGGGAIRILDPNSAGANNMVDCKFDLSVKNDPKGSVMIRWLPEILCIDQSNAWGNPEGAVFNNTLVRRKRDPVAFMAQVAIPYAHPNASMVNITAKKQLPGLVSLYSSTVDPSVKMVTNMVYYAAMIEFNYKEDNRLYSERMVTVIEDYGINGGGLWKNRQTMFIRTPQGEMVKWEPLLLVIQNSGIWNLKWITAEVNGQRQRSGLIAATQKELQEMDNAINESRRKTSYEINKDMFLTLTGQNEYRNPHTGNVERDTDNWKYRWVNAGGEIIYSDKEAYDPNHDPLLNVSGFKKSVPRK
ncbi:MAG: hypothetical protein IPJ37_16620 [Bacteroidales bacterium]|nr:hypothetical protein [Bacteroidales bacterium]